MADVFISYARTDEKVARRVASVIQKAGYSVWWDADLPAHRSYSEEIESHLREAKAVVVLWSKEAAASQWVRAEADIARNDSKLVQLSVDGTIPPIPFNQIQCADLTGWRGGGSHGGIKKAIDSVAALSSKDGATPPTAVVEDRWWNRPMLRWSALAAVLLLAAAAFLIPRFWVSEQKRPVVAVLPFESLDKRDSSLVAGIWEDTRQAIGRNPQLLVLGPNTAEEIAEKGGKTAAKLADYLVEASVRSADDRVRVSANLVRTKDGVAVWNKSFDRRLDDVFALQSEIAAEIEGHIRGRLARRGGVQPENIATSGEVYALYSDARAKIRRRDFIHYRQAAAQLQEVVRRDPNFAPGWATLSVSKTLGITSTEHSDAAADARRSISLAPNLAAGHAALGFAIGEGPAATAALRKALALDPQDIEALNWLANSLDDGEQEEKLRLYTRIVEIEPLWWPAILNKLNLLTRSGNEAALLTELKRVESAGDTKTAGIIKIRMAELKGDLSEAAKIGITLYKQMPQDDRESVGNILWAILLQLGLTEAADRISHPPSDFVPYLRKNDPRALDMIESRMTPRQFWQFGPLPIIAGRVYLINGQATRHVAQYSAVAKSPAQFEKFMGKKRLIDVAPTLSLALRKAGRHDTAAELLARAEAQMESPVEDPESGIQLARIRAAQGRKQEALSLVESAARSGWLPPFLPVHTDIALDPPLAELKSEPRFEPLRQYFLRTIARERAELGPVTL